MIEKAATIWLVVGLTLAVPGTIMFESFSKGFAILFFWPLLILALAWQGAIQILYEILYPEK